MNEPLDAKVSVLFAAEVVAAAEMTKLTFGLMLVIVAPLGMPGPEITWPTTRPAVLLVVNVVVALVVALMVAAEGFEKTSTALVAVAVAFAEMVNVFASTMLVMIALAGRPVPTTSCPTERLEVSDVFTVALAFVVLTLSADIAGAVVTKPPEDCRVTRPFVLSL